MLTDKFSRQLNYLRVSITDKCNLRCEYCMPSEGIQLLHHDEILRNEEFIHFIGIFVHLGIDKIRFTGGEPLLRKGFIDIVSNIRKLFPDIELCLTTNGILLDEVLKELQNLKVSKLNISLDSMSRDRFKKITGRDYFSKVISNIQKALSLDFFEIKINSVLYEETIEELEDFFNYFKNKKVILRFIERMPFLPEDNKLGRTLSDHLTAELEKKGNLVRHVKEDTRVAMMYDFQYMEKYWMKIGIIPSISHNFCSGCNRLRLTCDGFLRTCLHSNKEFDLKSPYRMDMGDEALERIILQAVSEKPPKHNLDCNITIRDGCASLLTNRTMSKIGG